MNKTIAITGASGFIGKRLVTDLDRAGGYEIRVLSRDKQRDLREERFGKGVEIFEGDLSDPGSLKRFLVPGCTVVNLAYLWKGGEELNLACTHNLLEACKDTKVARLIHCSTVAVTGRVMYDLCDEQTQCMPTTEYAMTKLRTEQAITAFPRKQFDAVILRPTAVLGIGGQALTKLGFDISERSRWENYLKSCLFGRRRMNLVPVANVTAAIIFLTKYIDRFDGEIFIVSDDDDPKNNFVDVERFMMGVFGVEEYRLPRLPVPLVFLKLILILLSRNNVNPRCDFDPGKLRKLGFKSPVSLSEGLAEYAAWHRTSHHGEKSPKAS